MDSVSKKISGDRGELENLLCAFSQEMREVVEEIRIQVMGGARRVGDRGNFCGGALQKIRILLSP